MQCPVVFGPRSLVMWWRAPPSALWEAFPLTNPPTTPQPKAEQTKPPSVSPEHQVCTTSRAFVLRDNWLPLCPLLSDPWLSSQPQLLVWSVPASPACRCFSKPSPFPPQRLVHSGESLPPLSSGHVSRVPSSERLPPGTLPKSQPCPPFCGPSPHSIDPYPPNHHSLLRLCDCCHLQ